MGCLYQLIFPNGKSYIGITNKTAKQRFGEHCRNSVAGIAEYQNGSLSMRPTLLGKAIREFGKENVIVRTLVVANDIEFLKELEIKAIKRYRTLHSYGAHSYGYNMSKGNCPKEIDWVVKARKWRVTLKPLYDWPPNYFENEAIYIADFNTLDEARRVCVEILSEEDRMWRETVYAEWLRDPNCYDGYYGGIRYVVT
jgi:hypothetical protein